MIRNLVFIGTFIYIVIAWFTAKSHVLNEHEHALNAWIADISPNPVSSNQPNTIVIAKSQALCEFIDCDKNYSTDDYTVILAGHTIKKQHNLSLDQVYDVKGFEKVSDNQFKLRFSAPNRPGVYEFVYPNKP